MNYGEIKKTDIANGEGVRVTLFVSGCRIHCKGCFNSATWDFCFGQPYTQDTEEEIIQALKEEYISGLTVLGGEPFEEENQRELVNLMRRVKQTYPSKNIWCFTGYIFENDLKPANGKKHCEVTDEMLSYIDVLIDGPYIEEKKDWALEFRGSSNQRILKLNELR